MLNWLKDWLNPTPYNSTTNFKCDVPMPKVKPPRVEGISEPVLSILKSINESSREWKIRRTNLEFTLYVEYKISDKNTGLSFELYSDTHNILDIELKYNHLDWMTWTEQKAVIRACADLYIKRIKRLEAIQGVTKDNANDKVRNYWKEKYQC